MLDFGCDPGRFTLDLALLLNGKAIGVDPIAEFLNEAPRGENVEYSKLEDGRIPLADSVIDVVWIYLVLGGIDGLELNESVLEIKRVLKKSGLVCLIEVHH
ncbi:MAG: class I SAM-dependent methyltransferase [archaeon]